MFYVGMKVKIKPEAWKRDFPNEPYPFQGIQIITDMPDHPPFDDAFMLSFPLHWWKEDDLEMI
jgi:hypothetical protein